MAHHFYKSTLFWAFLFLLGVINPLVYMMPTQIAFEILNSLIISVYAGVFWGYVRSGMDVLEVPPPELRTSDLLTLAIVLLSLGLVCLFGTLWIWRLVDDSDVQLHDPIINHWIGAMGRWIIVAAGLLLLATSHSIQGRIPRKSYMKMGCWLTLGLSITGIAITFIVRNGMTVK
jgi:hypothetical protein